MYMYSITKESKSFYIFLKKTKLNYYELTLINQPPPPPSHDSHATTTKLY